MAVGDRRYSQEQIDAVVRMALDGPSRVSVPECLRHAAAGTLPGADGKPMPAFVGNAGTFGDYVAKEARLRRRRDVIADGGQDAAQLLAARLVAVGEREVQKLERRAARNKATARDIRECIGLVSDLVKLRRTAGLPDVAPTGETAPAKNGKTDAPADDLLAGAPTTPAPIV